jgi:hypothetical protein
MRKLQRVLIRYRDFVAKELTKNNLWRRKSLDYDDHYYEEHFLHQLETLLQKTQFKIPFDLIVSHYLLQWDHHETSDFKKCDCRYSKGYCSCDYNFCECPTCTEEFIFWVRDLNTDKRRKPWSDSNIDEDVIKNNFKDIKQVILDTIAKSQENIDLETKNQKSEKIAQNVFKVLSGEMDITDFKD